MELYKKIQNHCLSQLLFYMLLIFLFQIILFLFLILLILAILFVIGAFVPSIGHFMDCFCELFGKLYDSFWSLFGLKPPQPSINPNNKGDIRRIFTGVIIIVIINYLFVKAKYVFNKEYYK